MFESSRPGRPTGALLLHHTDCRATFGFCNVPVSSTDLCNANVTLIAQYRSGKIEGVKVETASRTRDEGREDIA